MKNTIQSPSRKTPRNRIYIGLLCFGIAFGLLPSGLILQNFIHPHFWKAFVISIFWVSAQVLKVAAIAIMGKQTYLWIISGLRSHYFTYIFPKKISRARYYFGLVLFLMPSIANHLIAYTPRFTHFQYEFNLYEHLVSDLLFVISLFVLGGDFWDKLRALFVFESSIRFGPRTHATTAAAE